jgi:SAM-dependent methyltransferase
MSRQPSEGIHGDAAASQADNWRRFHGRRNSALGRYPTEWVVRTLAGGNYPDLKMDKSKYPGARILDMGCGDGRNLPLLLDLGFEVHACEVSEESIAPLRRLAESLHWAVSFQKGMNHSLHYPNDFFDYMLCCASCYYLDEDVTWPQVRTELARVLKPGGFLVANFCDEDNFILRNSVPLKDGSFRITQDPFGLRNGCRFMTARDRPQLTALLSPQFLPLGVGHLCDDYYGIKVSGHVVVAQRQD